MDVEGATWTVPASRMEASREHRVPLCACARDPRRGGGSVGGRRAGVPRPASRGRPLSENTHAKLLRELGFDAVTHGFRSSFRDYAAEQTHTPHEVMEAALAHRIKDKAEAAYARSDLFDKRREPMESWARYLALLRTSRMGATGAGCDAVASAFGSLVRDQAGLGAVYRGEEGGSEW